jgi:hypothetical protein
MLIQHFLKKTAGSYWNFKGPPISVIMMCKTTDFNSISLDVLKKIKKGVYFAETFPDMLEVFV